MKKISLLIITIIGLTFGSCQITEEISFKDNGSGSFKLNMDMSSMMSMMNEMKEDSTANSEKVYELQDTIINFNDIIKEHRDSINKLSASEKAKIEALKDMKMHLLMDEKGGKFLMSFMGDFKNINELKDMQKKIKSAQQMQNQDESDAKQDIENHKIEYDYSKNLFSRKVTMLELNDEEKEQFEAQLGKAKMVMAQSIYKIKYHFPKKIKSTNLKNANISENGHTLEYEINMNELINDPTRLDFEVKF